MTSRRITALGAAWFVFVAMLIVSTPRIWSQENATVNGTVTDPSGAVVANAEITITNPATGQKRTVTSNGDGAFRFANLGIGTYTMSASAQGFRSFTRTGIVVNVAQTLEENVVLAIGSAAQTVTVEADALQVQTETSEVSTLISGQQVEQLATNGRNVVQLAALGLGVSNNLPAFGGIDALTSANGISFNGQRAAHNVYLLDGAEQNDRGCGGCFMNLPSQDAIAEFQTLDSNYQPDYGLGSGGTVVMVLKSGSHNYHGELYESNRNTDYNANDYFLKRGGKARPTFQLNEPGGNISGPIWIPHVYDDARNRTFFFWNEEWRKLIQGSSPSVQNAILANNFPTAGQAFAYTLPSATAPVPIVPVLPNNAAINALYTTDQLTPGQPFPKNQDGTYEIPLNLIDQNAVLELNAGTFPKPNFNNGTQYIASINAPENIREDVVRIDHSINSKMQLMGHYLHDAMTKTFFPPLWGDSTYPTVGTLMGNPSYTAAIKLTQTYSPSLLNETAFFYSGNKISLTPIPGAGDSFVQPSGWSATSYFPTANNLMSRLPEIQLQGTPLNVTWSPSYYPWKNGYEGFQYRDDLSWTRGHHQFKFGASWLHDYKNQQLQANTQGTAVFNSSTFSGDSYINFLLGMTANFEQLEYLAGKHWVNNNYSGYANDNWHIRPRLTLNIGIRFDGLPHAFERYNRFSNFVIGDYDTSLPNPVQSDGTLDPAQLSTFAATGSEQFYLNGIREAGVGGFPRGNVQNRYFTWQPRVGFAWQMDPHGKNVLRGGLGVFYERVQGNDVYNAALNPPFAYQPSANNVDFSNPNSSVLTGQTSTQHFPSSLFALKYNYPPPGTINFSLGIQRQLAPSVIAVVQYVGSTGWDQNDDRQVNTLPLQTDGSYATRQGVAGQIPNPSGSGNLPATNANLFRQFPGFANIDQEENTTNTNYNSLQAGVRVENRWGVTTQVAYTWSHEIDDVSGDLSGLSDPFNTRYDRGSGSLDRRQDLNISMVYSLPFLKHSSNVAARTILGNWGFSGIIVAESGTPQVISYNGSTDTLGLGGGTSNRPDLTSKVTYPKKQTQWFSQSSFIDPVAPWNGGTGQGFGTAGKDAVTLPRLVNFNLSLVKNIPLTSHEGQGFELRFESFNTFNHTQFSGLDANSHDGNFGQITSIYSPRILELGGKFRF